MKEQPTTRTTISGGSIGGDVMIGNEIKKSTAYSDGHPPSDGGRYRFWVEHPVATGVGVLGAAGSLVGLGFALAPILHRL